MTEKKILLVEDNPDDITLTLQAFERHHIHNTVDVVKDGAEALDYLFCTGIYAANPPPQLPELVLLDLHLPRIDGLTVLERLRATPRTRYLPVVVLTASQEQEDLIRSYEFGANSFVRKPVEFAQFVTAVQQLGLYWLLLNQVPRGE